MNQEFNKLCNSYKAAFGTESGRRVLEDLQKAFHVHYTTFKGQSVDEMVFNEGERSVVLYIKNLIDYKESKVEEEEDNG